jgi:hypothetical protein
VPKQGETSTETLNRPRLEGSTPTEMARAPKRPRDSSGPGTYKEVLINIKIAIFRETYPEDKVTKLTRTVFWKNWEGCYVGL